MMGPTAQFEQLNSVQQEAVTSSDAQMLVLAGAGSGKTRVLVNRTAWLIQNQALSPYSILAVTFTNKAAAEMRSRVEQMIHLPTQGMWIGTFHSLAHRLLRMHWQDAHLQEHFQILDADDQLRLVKRVLKSLNIDESYCPPKQVQWFINAKKDEGLRAKDCQNARDGHTKTLASIYQAYEQACERGGLVDFAELLLRAYELWRDNKSILDHYRQRFAYTLIDEFQDTNTLQYKWIKLLLGESGHFMIVGDDDQSIYSWRGAKVENILHVTQDFPNTNIIRLEQNYRSTETILSAANGLIAHNTGRMGKELWTEGNKGTPIALYNAYNEEDEARFIVDRIKVWLNEGRRASHAAILYRSNAQSRVLEEALIMAGIPYRIYGGLRFFERQEIKDALGYMRLFMNRGDDAAFERVVNTPTRGIGARTLSVIRDVARGDGTSMWDAATSILQDNQLAARASTALRQFMHLIDDMAQATAQMNLPEQVEHMLEVSGLFAFYRSERGEKAQARVENLEELISAAKQFISEREDDDLPILVEFLSHAALEAGERQAQAYEDCVQLMTLHSAKGLEFPLVFMAGMEEGLFPHQMSYEEEGRLEEERRLCYVGMTRAMEHLYLTTAESRRVHGTVVRHSVSRFITEMPQEHLQEVRATGRSTRPMSPVRHANTAAIPNTGLSIGQRVQHPKFGEGVIIAHEGSGDHTRVQVRFDQHGTKWLVLAYAKLSTA